MSGAGARYAIAGVPAPLQVSGAVSLSLSAPQSGKSVCKRARLDSRTAALQTLSRVPAAQRTAASSGQSVQR